MLDFLGQNEFALRLPSAIAGTLCVPLIYWLANLVFKDRKLSLVAAGLLIISPIFIQYSQEARGYILVVFFLLCQAITMIYALERRKWIYWILLSVFTMCQFAMQYSGIVMSFCLYLYALAYEVRRYRENPPGFVMVLASGILFLLISCPLLEMAFGSYSVGPSSERWSWGHIGLSYVVYLWNDFAGEFIVAPIIYGVLFILGLRTMLKDHVRYAGFLVFMFAAPVVLTAMLSLSMNMAPRYVLGSAVFLLMIVAYSVKLLPCLRAKHGTVACVLFVVLLLTPIASTAVDYARYDKEDFRGAAGYLSDNAVPGDAVVYAPGSINSVYAALSFYYVPEGHGVSAIAYTNETALHEISVDPFIETVYLLVLRPNDPFNSVSDCNSPNCLNVFSNESMFIFKITGQYW